MMTNNEDSFEWARHLECPPSARTDFIKKTLNSGITSLLWDELSSVVHPTKESVEVRKNILLYKLRHGEKELSIQNIQNLQQLREASRQLNPQIESLTKKCEQRDLLVRQKEQQLSKVKLLRKSIKTKEDLIRMKLSQMQTQIQDCKEMRLVCRHLMPPTSCKIDPNIVKESLSLVGIISTKADKKITWNKISETLSTVNISTLWNTLLSSRIRDTEELMALGTLEIADNNNESKSGKDIDIGVARVCGQFVATAAQRLIYRAKLNQQEKLIMEYIEKIEGSDTNTVDVSEWLALTLEVRKLEAEQSSLQSEVDRLKRTLEHQCDLNNELSNLESDIHGMDTKVERCVQEIQKSLTLLKPAGLGIARTKDKLFAVLQKIAALHSENQNFNYLDIDLGTEMNIFHDSLKLEALRKVGLKDAVGAYRLTKCCISKARQSMTSSSQSKSQFPMLRVPIYELLNCYKNLVTASSLAKLEIELDMNDRNSVGEWLAPLSTDCSTDAIETLNMTDLTRDRVHEELRQFDLVFDAWNYQTVEKAMLLDYRIVNGATFKEWVKRYDTLLYMVRRTK